jgi:hypothetical protein
MKRRPTQAADPPSAPPARSAAKPPRKKRMTPAPQKPRDPVFEALRAELGL